MKTPLHLAIAAAGMSAAMAMEAPFIGRRLPGHFDLGRGPRGKGKQARPARRPNMLHVSRRTRRKHRRATRR